MKVSRIAAAVLAVLLALAIVLCAVYLIHAAEHDCPGAGCAVCARIEAVRGALRIFVGLLLAAAVTAVRLRSNALLGVLADRSRAAETPVRTKVKLLN